MKSLRKFPSKTVWKYQWFCHFASVFPQIAIAIGVLTSNRRGGQGTTFAHWTWHQNAIAGCSGRGAIAGSHCSVLWLSGRGAIVCYGWVDVVPLLGAIAGCHCSVRWLGGRVTTNFGGGRGGIAGCYGWGGDGQLWRSGRGAIAGCHCSVLWLGGGWRPTLGGVDVVPFAEWTLQGAIAVCFGWGEGDDQLTWRHCWVPL